MRRIVAYSFVAAWFLIGADHANATILTFDIFNSIYSLSQNYPEGYAVEQQYGDNVTATSGSIPGGTTFNYGIGAEGFTPNVQASYGPTSIFTGGPALWRYDYGNLTNVLYQGSTFTGVGFDYDFLEIGLTAAPGFDVLLYGFDLGGWFSDFTIKEVAVLTGSNSLYSQSNVNILSGANHTSFAFASPIRASSLKILIDSTNIGASSELVGIDNIRFGQALSQTTPVPEPASLGLFAIGSGLAAIVRRRKRNTTAR
jgi:hypothetical protein